MCAAVFACLVAVGAQRLGWWDWISVPTAQPTEMTAEPSGVPRENLVSDDTALESREASSAPPREVQAEALATAAAVPLPAAAGLTAVPVPVTSPLPSAQDVPTAVDVVPEADAAQHPANSDGPVRISAGKAGEMVPNEDEPGQGVIVDVPTVAELAKAAQPRAAPAPVMVAPLPAAPDQFWTVIVGSFARRTEADRAAERLSSAGFAAGVLFSTDYPTLNPGYWCAYSGRLVNRESAVRTAARLQAAGFTGAYAREVRR